MAIESIGSTEFGDLAVAGNCATLDDVNAVPIYEFTAGEDGAYTLVVTLLVWQPGGTSAQHYIQATWVSTAGTLLVDGAPFVGAVGSLSPSDIFVDVSGGKGRLMVKGISAQPLLWRMKGHRFDLVAGAKYPSSTEVESTTTSELGDLAVSGGAATLDGTAVPIYRFSPPKDGAYTVEAIVLAWMPGGSCSQYYVEVSWKNIGGAVTIDGIIVSDPVGALSAPGVTADVSAGQARLLVTGLPGRQILWRMKGARLDVTA